MMSFFVRLWWCILKILVISFRWFIWVMWFLSRWRILVVWFRGLIYFLWLCIVFWSYKLRILYFVGLLGLFFRVALKMKFRFCGIGLNFDSVFFFVDWSINFFFLLLLSEELLIRGSRTGLRNCFSNWLSWYYWW